MKRLKLDGKKYGELTVINYSHSHIQPSKQKRAMWNVICSCGVKKKVATANLISGGTISCGHIGQQNRILSRKRPDGESAFNSLYLSYKHSAKNRGHVFDLSKEIFRKIVSRKCYYCGKEKESVHKGKYKTWYTYNGIDRINNSLGYTFKNIVTCCQICNRMKHTLTQDDFINHINRIYGYASIKKRVQQKNYIKEYQYIN